MEPSKIMINFEGCDLAFTSNTHGLYITITPRYDFPTGTQYLSPTYENSSYGPVTYSQTVAYTETTNSCRFNKPIPSATPFTFSAIKKNNSVSDVIPPLGTENRSAFFQPISDQKCNDNTSNNKESTQNVNESKKDRADTPAVPQTFL